LQTNREEQDGKNVKTSLPLTTKEHNYFTSNSNSWRIFHTTKTKSTEPLLCEKCVND